MKTNKILATVTLGVFFFSTLITFANNNEPIKKEKKKENNEMAIVATPMELNEEYLVNVHENSSQKEAKFLSNIISQYNVKESPLFGARRNSFTTVFKSNKGLAEVEYDNEGRVIAVEKRLKNVQLPIQIQKVVFKRYENWVIVKNRYNVSYKQGFDVEKSYLITIRNGKETKVIRVNA